MAPGSWRLLARLFKSTTKEVQTLPRKRKTGAPVVLCLKGRGNRWPMTGGIQIVWTMSSFKKMPRLPCGPQNATSHLIRKCHANRVENFRAEVMDIIISDTSRRTGKESANILARIVSSPKVNVSLPTVDVFAVRKERFVTRRGAEFEVVNKS